MPCSGKSYHIKYIINNNQSLVFKQTYIKKFLSFIYGLQYLGIKRANVFLIWSFKEHVPFIYKINIFCNAVIKFGLYKILYCGYKEGQSSIFIDEGLSHLTFLFLKTETKLVINFVTEELKRVNVHFIKSPECSVIYSRLKSRGHKRLKYMSTRGFIKRNKEIEKCMLKLYPVICNKFDISINA